MGDGGMREKAKMGEQAMAERRRYPRVPMKDNVFVVLRPEFDKLGRVRDLSLGGVCFEYTSDSGSQPTANVEADIFTTPKRVYLSRIACKVVHTSVLEGAAPAFSGLVVQRCGLQFEYRDSAQREQVKQLLAAQAA